MVEGGLLRSSSQVPVTCIIFLLVGGCSPERCPPGLYYDPAVERCDLCDGICQLAEIRGTIEDCHKYCPVYRHRLTTKPTPRKTGFSETSTRPSEESSTDHHILLIPVFAGVGLCVGAILLAFIVFRRERQTLDVKRKPRVMESPYLKTDLLSNVKGPPMCNPHTNYKSSNGDSLI